MKKSFSSQTKLPSEPGFTWELFLIAVIFLSALVTSAAASIAIANNNNPHLFLLLTALSLLVMTLKVTPLLANKYRERQRAVLRNAEAVMKDDPRAPVLYLRSFKDDEMIARAIAFYSIEQEMKLALFEIGPFIALAEPGKDEPQDPGAARMRLPHDAWQDKVAEEMSRAALVIMRLGASEGLLWELREAPNRVDPKRLVLLIPPEDELAYEEFRVKNRGLLPRPLPEVKRTQKRLGFTGGIVYFEADWTPRFRKFKVEWFRQTFWNTFAAVLKMSLQPVYEQLGIKWTMPPVQPIQFLYWLVLCLLSVLGIYLTYALISNIARVVF